MDADGTTPASATIRWLVMGDSRRSDPFSNLPETIELNNCPDCGEPTYYEDVLTGQMRLHFRTGSFLCPEPRSDKK